MPITDQSNLSDIFNERVNATPDAVAYRQFDGATWKALTWSDTGREVARWQAALKREGLKTGERVAMCLHNRVEWVLLDQAAIGLGLVTVPLYFDDRPENMAWCLNDAGVKLLLLEDGAQWAALKDNVKTLERIVCVGGHTPNDPRVRRLSDWVPGGSHELIRASVTPNELATIVYTSGT